MATPRGALGPIHTEPLLGGAYSGTIPSCVVNIARGSPWTFLSTDFAAYIFSLGNPTGGWYEPTPVQVFS